MQPGLAGCGADVFDVSGVRHLAFVMCWGPSHARGCRDREMEPVQYIELGAGGEEAHSGSAIKT